MKKIGDTHLSTRQEIRRLKQILTFDEYEQIVRRIINIAINGDNDKNALTAAMYIIDKLEGKTPDVVIAGNTLTARDLLSDE